MLTNEKVFSNFMWKLCERWGAQGVTFVVSIILARLIEPEEYGILALVMVIITFLQVFVDSGLGTSLIQKKEADDLDFSTVFWFNIIACSILYMIVFFTAPAVSNFYNMKDLVPIIRVVGLILVISGIKGIQQAYVAKNLMFKKFFFSTLGGTVVAAFVGVYLAYKGWGVWALVIQCLVNNTIDTAILWVTVKWKPRMIFSYERFKKLFDFGWKILLSSLLNTLYNELRVLIIGKFYSAEDLAFYDRGKQFPEIAVNNINTSMNSVLLPVLSSKQDDIFAIKDATRRIIRSSSYIIWPMMIGMCVVADRLVAVILGDKWIPAIFFLKVLCLAKAFQPLQTTNLSVIKALGKADLHLKLEIIKKSIAILIVIISSFWGVEQIAIGSLIYCIIASLINAHPNKKMIGYGYLEQIKDICPYIGMSIIMAVFVYFVGLIELKPWILLIVQILVGVFVYLVMSVIFKVDTFLVWFNTLKNILNNIKQKN